MSTTLRLAPIAVAPDSELRADDAEFRSQYKAWMLRRRINLPDGQLKLVCQIFFNFGISQGVRWADAEIDRLKAYIGDLQHDLATKDTDDDGLSESERLTRAGYDGH